MPGLFGDCRVERMFLKANKKVAKNQLEVYPVTVFGLVTVLI